METPGYIGVTVYDPTKKGHKVDIEIKILKGSSLSFALNSNMKDFRIQLPDNCPMDQKCFVSKNKVISPATQEDMREW